MLTGQLIAKNPSQVEKKTKVTKEAVETITRGMGNLKEVTDVLKDTMQKADDAETLAHDALQSIDARADLITRNAFQLFQGPLILPDKKIMNRWESEESVTFPRKILLEYQGIRYLRNVSKIRYR